MSSLWEQRAARNEAFFREVNENIARLEERHGAPLSELLVVCECAQDGCAERLAVAPEAYNRVRAHPRRFLVLPGHQDPRLERVVETTDGYLIVEKTGPAGEAVGRIH